MIISKELTIKGESIFVCKYLKIRETDLADIKILEAAIDDVTNMTANVRDVQLKKVDHQYHSVLEVTIIYELH